MLRLGGVSSAREGRLIVSPIRESAMAAQMKRHLGDRDLQKVLLTLGGFIVEEPEEGCSVNVIAF